MIQQEPIFILSAPRSGSTLLRVMLAGHPKLLCPPELNLMQFETMQAREKALGPCPHTACQPHNCDQRTGLQRAFMELQHSDEVMSGKTLQALIEKDEPVAGVFEILRHLAAPRQIVDKSPSYSAAIETMERIRRIFPKAKYIYIHRHPYAVIESLLRNGFEGSLEKAESVWVNRNANIQKFLPTLDSSQWMRIAYEKLVSNPHCIMGQLCDFLGIEFDPAILNPYEGVRMTDGVRPGHMPPGDANFHTHTGIDASLGEAWRTLKLPGPAGSATRQLGTELMYEVS
jgi:hypothetical protein